MNSYGGTANARPLIGLGAAGVLIVSFFLPWLTYLGQSVSLAEMAAKSSGGGWLTLLLLIGGAILAAVGAGLRASGSASVSGSRRALAICWVAGFGASLGGFALYLLDLSSYSSVSYFGYSYSTGLGAGFGVWLGLVAAVGGLIVGLVDMAAGRNESWGPAYGPSSAPPWSAPPAPTGWQNPAAVQPAAPAGAWAAAGSVGRISYVESGRASSLVVAVGDQVMVGRDADARIRLTDPKVSRRHLMVAWAGNGWSVRDLGATNPTRLLGPSGTAQRVVGEMRVASGQLLVGDVLVTLFPVGA